MEKSRNRIDQPEAKGPSFCNPLRTRETASHGFVTCSASMNVALQNFGGRRHACLRVCKIVERAPHPYRGPSNVLLKPQQA
jgi:hypothetical protein